MTGRRLPALALLTALLLSIGAVAEERILEFRTDVGLQPDGSFVVEEKIVYSFGDASKHGIYRDIPIRYGRGVAADYRIALEVESVRNGDGAERPYDLSNEGVYRRIRIGHPKRTVTGVQEYRIRYHVRRGILWLEEHDELYWNATGTEWQVPIDAADVTIRAPRGAGEQRAPCFTGPRGSVGTAWRIDRAGGATRGRGPAGTASTSAPAGRSPPCWRPTAMRCRRCPGGPSGNRSRHGTGSMRP